MKSASVLLALVLGITACQGETAKPLLMLNIESLSHSLGLLGATENSVKSFISADVLHVWHAVRVKYDCNAVTGDSCSSAQHLTWLVIALKIVVVFHQLMIEVVHKERPTSVYLRCMPR